MYSSCWKSSTVNSEQLMGEIMRRALIVAAFLAVASHHAHAGYGYENGNNLLMLCTDGTNLFSQGMCLGYFQGVIDEVITVQAANNSGPCVPTDVTGRQLVDVVLKYLREHPETRNQSAALLATLATIEAWPCK
jgi:Rap1a immunity proteins